MQENPLVSVLMTAYNREQYIAEAIDSVLASTLKNFELIVVDDCSSDNTVSIAKNYESQDSRIRVHVNAENLGDYANRNNAAKFAKGKYLKYVDSDDKLYPEGLEYCVMNMERCKSAEWGIIFAKPIEKKLLLYSEEAILTHFFKQPFLKIGPGGTILRKDFFFRIGMYPTIYGPANDMYFNLLAASKGNVLLLKDNFLFYRLHEGQEQNNQFSYLYNNYRYLRDALEDLDLHLTRQQIKWLQLKLKRRFSVNITRYFLRTKDIDKTKKVIDLAGFSIKDLVQGVFHYRNKPKI